MEAPEVPLEAVQDHISEHAEHAEARWIPMVALSTAIFAATAAVASMLAGQHINEAMMSQIKASDQWAYYQAKGIKLNVLKAKEDILAATGKPVAPQDGTQDEKYKKEQEEIAATAREKETEASENLERHEKLAFAVTLFQIAIAVSAIAVLTKSRLFWYVGLLFGCSGIGFLIYAHLHHAAEIAAATGK